MFWLLTKVSSIYMKWSWPISYPLNSSVAWRTRYWFQILNKERLVSLMEPSSVQRRKGFLSLFLILWKRIHVLCGAVMKIQPAFFRLQSNIVMPKSLALSMVLLLKAPRQVLEIPPTKITYDIWQGCQHLLLQLLTSQVQLCRCKENYNGLRLSLSLSISRSFKYWLYVHLNNY